MLVKLKLKKYIREPFPHSFPADYTIRWKGKQNDSESGITCSLLYEFLTCRTKFLLALWRWYKDSNSAGLAYGTLFHHYLENHYSELKNFSGKEIGRMLYKYANTHKEDFEGLEKTEMTRLLALGEIMALAYQEFYDYDFKKYKVVSNEEKFDVEWNGYRLRGKKDMLYRDKDGKLKLWENKNFWQISSEITDLLKFDQQFMFYMLAQEMATGEIITGGVYNITRVPQNEMTKGLSIYKEKMKKLIAEKPAYYFVRYDLVYTESERRAFNIDLDNMLKEVQMVIEGKLPVYKNRRSCDSKYKCKMIGACANNSLTLYKQRDTRFPELKENN